MDSTYGQSESELFFWAHILRTDGLQLGSAPQWVQDNYWLVTQAVNQNALAFQFASARQRMTGELVESCLAKHLEVAMFVNWPAIICQMVQRLEDMQTGKPFPWPVALAWVLICSLLLHT